MKYRKLRIAWSVAWGVVAVLLLVLWVRSYTIADGVMRLGKTELGILSFRGILDFSATGDPSVPHIVGTGWKHYETDVTGDSIDSLPYRFGFHIANSEDGIGMQRFHLIVTGGLVVAIVVLGVLLWRQGRATTQPSAPAAGPLTRDDESGVRAVVAEFANSWNRHDMKAMHKLNNSDVEWVNVTANHWQGNSTVFKGHDAIHRTIFAKTDMSVEKTSVRAIAPDVVVAVATMKFGPVTIPSGQVLSEMRTRGSFMVVRRDGIWKIAHFQNTTIDADAEKNDPITWDEKGFPPAPRSVGTDELEQEIRKIDRAEAAAVLATDIPAIEKFWADDFTVNAPNNQILKGKTDALKLVKDGILDYSSFERAVEAVLVQGDTAIVMGEETVKPKAKAPFAGQTLRRRVTNIWMKRDGQWKLTARQATILSRD